MHDRRCARMKYSTTCTQSAAVLPRSTSLYVPVREGRNVWCHSSRLATVAVMTKETAAHSQVQSAGGSDFKVARQAWNRRKLSVPYPAKCTSLRSTAWSSPNHMGSTCPNTGTKREERKTPGVTGRHQVCGPDADHTDPNFSERILHWPTRPSRYGSRPVGAGLGRVIVSPPRRAGSATGRISPAQSALQQYRFVVKGGNGSQLKAQTSRSPFRK